MPQEMSRESGGQQPSYTGWEQAVPDSVREDSLRAASEAKRTGAAAYEQMKEGARSLGDEAKQRAARLAEEQKAAVSEHLEAFASAVKRAGDDLSERDHTMAAQVVRQAANGLESFSRSVKGTSFEDVVDSVRNFGRSNPAAFIGGAVLAGLALGRLARASGRGHSSGFREDEGEWYDDPGRYGGGRDWRDDGERSGHGRHYGGNEGIEPAPFERPSYSADERVASTPSSRTDADAAAPSQAQGYAGGGMRTDPVRSSTPSSATDASVVSSDYSTGSEPGVISTGETR